MHPLAARYESPEMMEAAFRTALVRIQAGDLPNLKLPTYHQAPPAPTGRPKLQVA
ncbi:hypothetical protein ABT144_05405 [Streptomyces sp. NPDC002039]|uniref:hypothetical protein n=1 Tax=unclassified Streptomyces TaxID=2593676 RepID=UPI00332549A5